MVARIAPEALIERLSDWGVDTVFGLPGDGINGIMEALRRHQDKIRFVLVHHEEAAAFMATAHAKATGKIGVCPRVRAWPRSRPIRPGPAPGWRPRYQWSATGYPEHAVRYPEPFVNYAALAVANGAFGIKVVRPGELPDAVRQALSHDGPALVDVNVNPEEPAMPGKVEYEQAFLTATPRRGGNRGPGAPPSSPPGSGSAPGARPWGRIIRFPYSLNRSRAEGRRTSAPPSHK